MAHCVTKAYISSMQILYVAPKGEGPTEFSAIKLTNALIV